jgi:hypothetical protein
LSWTPSPSTSKRTFPPKIAVLVHEDTSVPMGDHSPSPSTRTDRQFSSPSVRTLPSPSVGNLPRLHDQGSSQPAVNAQQNGSVAGDEQSPCSPSTIDKTRSKANRQGSFCQ